MLVEFLAKHHLNYENDIEAAFGVFDSDENLTGCGCCAGNLLKCFAVDESLRGQNALGSLVSRLVENRFEAGHYDLFVITRPKNKVLFTSCGFYPLAEKKRENCNRKFTVCHWTIPDVMTASVSNSAVLRTL